MRLWPKTIAKGACRHDALYCASAAQGEGCQARIVYGQQFGRPHVIAQALIDGKWVTLDRMDNRVKATSYPRGFEAEVTLNWLRYAMHVYRDQAGLGVKA